MLKKAKEITPGVTVHELLALVPDGLYTELAERFKADKWVQKLQAAVLFKLVLYSIFHSERLSLRVMETVYKQPDFQVLANAVGKTAHNSIRDRLRTVPVGYFAALYEHFYQAAEASYGSKVLERKYFVRRFDSTLVRTFAHYLAGMRMGTPKDGTVHVKYTVEFRDTFLLRGQLHTEQAYVSEERALGEAVQAANLMAREVLVFDRGLQKRAVFDTLTQDGKPFVIRLPPKARTKVLAELPLPAAATEKGFTVQRYAQVQLYRSGEKCSDTPYYLIEGTATNDKPLRFLTNLPPEEASAHTVAQLYQQRWDIEVLFRFLKQEMNLTHLVCHETDACTVMLYCLLIAAMLVLLYKKQNAIPSYKHAKILFIKELVNSIIYDMLQTPDGIERMKVLFKPPKRQ